MDRRTQKTRDAIFNALNSLLAKKNYSKITIQEIIDEANIGRSTFYAHFETKDDLLRAICTDLFEHIFSYSLASEKTHDFSFKEGKPNTMITHILYHLQDSKRNIKGILASESGDLFINYFKEYLYKLITNYLFTIPERNHKDIPDDFLINHISGSFVEMVRWWIKNDMQMPPEELTEYFTAVIFPII